MTPTFSVIIPTYGRPRYLGEAVSSVLEQTVTDFECIIVDDASPTPVQPERDPRLRIVRRERNGGPAAARNTGLEHARGRYVTFLDDDDLYLPQRLALAEEGLTRAPVALCLIQHLGGRSTPELNRKLEGYVHDIILEWLVPHVGQAVIRRDLAERFDERYHAVEDVEWWLRMTARAPVATVPGVGYLYRRHDAPRHVTSARAHFTFRELLMKEYESYFTMHPAAAAFQWKRIGIFARKLGDERSARQAFVRSLRKRLEPGTFWHLTRSLLQLNGGVRRHQNALEGDE